MSVYDLSLSLSVDMSQLITTLGTTLQQSLCVLLSSTLSSFLSCAGEDMSGVRTFAGDDKRGFLGSKYFDFLRELVARRCHFSCSDAISFFHRRAAAETS